jgi:hypothetical protein
MPKATLRRSKRIATKRPNATRARNRVVPKSKLSIYVHPDAAVTGGEPEYNGNGDVLSSHDAFGDFRVSKDFIVTADNSPNSYVVVQKVTKMTNVNFGNKVLKTTKQILDFTGGRVDNTCDSYYELFDIKADGESENYDKFANAAIAKYNDKSQVLDPNDAGFVFNTGTIVQEGTAACLKRGCPECEAILMLKWYDGEDTPAFGLPYLPYNAKTQSALAHAFSGAHSNVIVHTVNVVWDESVLDEGCPMSIVSNFIDGVPV